MQIEHAGGVGRGVANCPGNGHSDRRDIAQCYVHRQDRACEGAVTEEGGAVAFDHWRLGRDRVGHQHRVGARRERDLDHDRVHMDEVRDERRDETHVFERRAREPGRAVMQRTHAVEEVRHHSRPGVGRGERAFVVDGRVAQRHDDPRLRERARRRESGIGLGRERDEAYQVAVGLRDVAQELELDRAQHLRRMRAGSPAQEGALEVHAEDRVRTRGADAGRPFQHHVVRVERRAADREQQSRRAARDERVDRPDDLFDRRAGEVDRARAVDLEIDETGSEQHVTEIERGGGRVPGTGGDDPPARDGDPGRARRLPALAVDDAGALQRQRFRDSFHSAHLSFHSPRSVRGTREMNVLRAWRSSRTSTGISAVRSPARSTRKINSVSKRS